MSLVSIDYAHRPSFGSGDGHLLRARHLIAVTRSPGGRLGPTARHFISIGQCRDIHCLHPFARVHTIPQGGYRLEWDHPRPHAVIIAPAVENKHPITIGAREVRPGWTLVLLDDELDTMIEGTGMIFTAVRVNHRSAA
jgi:hypothetical protein